jgi:hypothetical protein
MTSKAQTSSHALHCRCGTLRGRVLLPAMTDSAICYCKDCQAYARTLEYPLSTLDSNGGTKIVPIHPGQVHFEQGLESLACMSLSEKGLLRWYAQCCGTPIGNTPRNMMVAYVGLVHTCLASSPRSLEQSFGPVRVHLNTQSATGQVKATQFATFQAMFSIAASLVTARLSGSYRQTPFFLADSGKPIRIPRVRGD